MDVLSILPAAWLPVLTHVVAWLVGACAAVGALAIALAAVKAALGAPSPTDPAWKARVFGWLKYADPIAANSQRAVDALKILGHELELAAQRRALAVQQQALSEQEVVIKLQGEVISASMRPPAMPPLDVETDTGRETPNAKKGGA